MVPRVCSSIAPLASIALASSKRAPRLPSDIARTLSTRVAPPKIICYYLSQTSRSAKEFYETFDEMDGVLTLRDGGICRSIYPRFEVTVCLGSEHKAGALLSQVNRSRLYEDISSWKDGLCEKYIRMNERPNLFLRINGILIRKLYSNPSPDAQSIVFFKRPHIRNLLTHGPVLKEVMDKYGDAKLA